MFKLNKFVALTAPIALAIGLSAPAPAKAQADPFLGQTMIVGYNFCPRGWANADGQLLAVNQYSALFSLFGTIYGGDGRTTFGLPDLRGRVPMHAGNGPGLTPRREGQRFGQERVTLTIPQMPSHNHQIAVNNAIGDSGRPGNDFLATPHANDPVNPDPDIRTYANAAQAGKFMNPAAVTNNGGGQSHENMPPTLVMRYCIALQGVYPSRN